VPLWDAQALQTLAQSRFGLALQPRALSRLLERWGLALQPLRELAAEHPEGAQWLDSQWDPGVRLSSGQQVWAGTLGHPDRPAPGGLVLAVSPRGSLRWLPVERLASADTYVDFLARLLRCRSGAWRVWLHGPALERAPAVKAWLDTQPRLSLQACPVAPLPRTLPESLPGPAPAPAAGRWPPGLAPANAPVPPAPVRPRPLSPPSLHSPPRNPP
jgi:sulfate adenylyltransferase subunit 2